MKLEKMFPANGAKFVLAWGVCTLIRLIPFRPPNIEPILATAMPFSRRMGGITGFVFTALNMALYDVITGKVGPWTPVTSLTYGVIGYLSAMYFRKIQANIMGYVGFAVIGTVVFDLITGVFMGPFLFGGSYGTALIGQIPFTLNHLLGNITFAIILSPLIDRWIVSNPNIETRSVLAKLARA